MRRLITHRDVFMQYFSGNLDDWDPQVTDGFAADHDVILFDNAGVGSSGGETPGTVSEMTRPGSARFDENRRGAAARDSGMGAVPSSDRYANLPRIKHPTLIVHGTKDIVVQPVNAFILARHLPDAQLIMYPDSNHGAQYQHAELFLKHAKLFLTA